MRRLLPLLLVASLASTAFGYGVGVVNGTTKVFLRLVASDVDVAVENQVAIVTTTQTFRNTLATDAKFVYAFPLSERASATDLRWTIGGHTYDAVIAAAPQDTSVPGPGGPHPDLTAYLGPKALYFPVDQTLKRDSLVTITLTYAELLPYSFGVVEFSYPSDYRLIQSAAVVDSQVLAFRLTSERGIDWVTLANGAPGSVAGNTGHEAWITNRLIEEMPNDPFVVRYQLNLDELGLAAMSTMIPANELPDELGGFFLFVAEPDPRETIDVIDKVFTLIIDRSGSMYGTKMTQAQNAAKYIVNNLNAGDRFNIVDFASDVKTFKPSHVLFDATNKAAAIAYINALFASGATNISGAFAAAIPAFSAANDTTANIIIFLTDGYPTSGVTITTPLANYVNDLVASTGTDVVIHTFGVGDVNKQLLTLIATNTDGRAEFLGADQMESRITSFYNTIRNPVLLGTTMTFNSATIAETYPRVLPNLYKGQQMIVSGRYLTSGATEVALGGNAFGRPVTYNYLMFLAATREARYQFLPKIWAKQKIEHLYVQHTALPSGSPQADLLRQEIVDLSMAYRVISPFTAFEAPPTAISEEEIAAGAEGLAPFELLGNYPNPFNPSTAIRIRVNALFAGVVPVRIYNALGQLVAVLEVRVSGPGMYEVVWDGTTLSGERAASGLYVYVVEMGDAILAGRMQLVR